MEVDKHGVMEQLELERFMLIVLQIWQLMGICIIGMLQLIQKEFVQVVGMFQVILNGRVLPITLVGKVLQVVK